MSLAAISAHRCSPVRAASAGATGIEQARTQNGPRISRRASPHFSLFQRSVPIRPRP
jgi:hypothetical protein